MSSSIITVENLSKRYVIGHQRGKGDGLRHAIEDAFRNPFKWLVNRKRSLQAAREEFWALKDVSFEVKQGEVMGIIGRNGAGKSTLLKILSRITEPTSGQIRIRGRVASLLEVGTGFHPELTGRENIFLNGAILGMSKVEIKRKFDEIVAFSEIEKFLDTPVKRYSSGMYVRLAFAVAAHLEPEILIVDEVLAVGDAEFQKKCLGKMQDASRGGRTVLLVSHNMQTIRHLCNRVILMEGGRYAFSGAAHAGVARYMGQDASKTNSSISLSNHPRNTEPQSAVLDRIEFLKPDGTSVQQLLRSGVLRADAYFTVKEPLEKLDIPMAIVHADGQRIFSESYSDHFQRAALRPGSYMVSFQIPLRFLKLESYFLVVGLYNEGRHCDIVEGIPLPELVDPSVNIDLEAHRWGIVRIPVEWKIVAPVN